MSAGGVWHLLPAAGLFLLHSPLSRQQTLQVSRVSEQDSDMRILFTNPTLPLPNELIRWKNNRKGYICDYFNPNQSVNLNSNPKQLFKYLETIFWTLFGKGRLTPTYSDTEDPRVLLGGILQLCGLLGQHFGHWDSQLIRTGLPGEGTDLLNPK